MSDDAEYYEEQGNEYFERGDYPKALEWYQKALEIREKVLGTEHPDTAVIYNNIAVVYNSQDDYAKSLDWCQKALAICEKAWGKEHPNTATTYNNIALVYDSQGDYPKALEWYQKALEIREKMLGKEHPDTATIYNNIAVVYNSQGDYPKALEWYQKALAIDEKVLGTEHPDTATTYNNIAVVYRSQGDYAKSLDWCQKALEIREKVLGTEHPDTAVTYNAVARVYRGQGDYAKALDWYQKALEIREKVLGKEHSDTAVIYNDIALVYHSQGDYPKALDWYQKALAIYEKVLIAEHPLVATTYNNIAGVYENQGDYPKALEWYQKALEIREKMLGKEHPDTAIIYNNITGVYENQGDYPKALEWYQKALSIYEKVLVAEHPLVATTYNNIAGVYGKQGDYAKSLDWYQKALAIDEKVLGTEHPSTAKTYNNIALVYHSQGDYPKALEGYQKALAIFEKTLGKQHPDYVSLLENLFGLYLTKKEYAYASVSKKEANQQRTSIVNHIFTFLSEHGREKYWNTLSSSFEANYSLSWFYPVPESNALSYDNALFTKGLLLRTTNAVRDSICASDNQELKNKYEELQALRRQIGNLQQVGGGDPAFIKELEDKAEDKERYLIRNSPAFREFQEGLITSWQKVYGSLEPGEAAIEFVSFRLCEEKWTGDTKYAALILLPGMGAPQWVPLPDCKKTLLEFLNELNELQNKNPEDEKQPQIYNQMYNEKGLGLYAAVWQPLESILKDAKTVYYSPSGLLHKISFNAIPTEGGVPLMDVYDLNLVSSTREIVNQKNKTTKKPDSGVVYGGLVYEAGADDMKREAEPYDTLDSEARKNTDMPDEARRGGYPQVLRYLDGTNREGKKVTEILSENGIPADLYTDTEGNEESFKSLNGKKKNVLHLATHGFFFGDIEKNYEERERLERIGGGKKVFENPLRRSGLALAGANNTWRGKPVAGVEDGILWADDVAGINLVGAQLVVLSACDTALGEVNNSEGVFGLQRAFKLAGAETLIMSLWGCNDDATCELMTSFYEKWLSGESKQEAFKAAQEELKKKYPSPFYWAAFVMID